MANRLRVTELDFDTIKTNLKTFLNQQSQFTDYDFEGSGLNVLLDILAYNTHYNAYYLNMVANESFLDTALLRDSVVSHAKALGYTPYSKSSSQAEINFTVLSGNNSPAKLTIPRGFSFLSNQIDGKSYNFIILDDVTVTKSNTNFTFESLPIREGQLVTYSYTHNESSNPKSIFKIEDSSVDTSTIKVFVKQSSVSVDSKLYSLSTDLLEIGPTSETYFIQEGRSGKYEIYFGNGVVGKKIPDGGVVTISYLVTNSTEANGADGFKASQSLTDTLSETHTNFNITVVTSAAGGSDRESVDSIKLLAPTQYASQNRLVTKLDYFSYLSRVYTLADSISVWGGEDQIPKVYGKIYISIKPKEGLNVSETEKQRIITEILNPKTVIGTQVEILNPEYVYLKATTNILYDKVKTSRSENSLRQLVQNAIVLYKNTNINKFEATFVTSKLQKDIDAVDISFVGSESLIRLEKRVSPILNQRFSYNMKFNIPLYRGTILNGLKTNEFNYVDGSITRVCQIEESPQSFTGVESVQIQNSGYGYLTTPTVTITGDGTGATAVATIVNGKIDSIRVTNRGSNYTKAIVTITGGNGVEASASATISNEIGTLRLFYYNSAAEKKIINSSIGTINYNTGEVSINDLNIQSIVSGNQLKVDIRPRSSIVEAERNTILTIDENDPTAITTVFEEL
jgi:hypothetical protein